MFRKRYLGIVLTCALLLLSACGNSGDQEAVAKNEKAGTSNLILATTTSTQDSGLLDVLIPLFEKENNVNVKTIAVGTGEALEMGKKGEADVLLVHAPDAEQVIVDSNGAINRKRVMYNDFVLVGSSEDEAAIKGVNTEEAFQKIFENGKTPFISRGDDSGTHQKELAIWKSLNLTPTGKEFYLETGQGMGATLQVAGEKEGYILTDRATFLAQQKNITNLEILVEGDKDLLNIYHVMQVNPEKHDMVNAKGAKAFVNFMVNDETQNVIEDFGKKEYGQSLFKKYTE
jgi:tungstate transport system substrate-binding protein